MDTRKIILLLLLFLSLPVIISFLLKTPKTEKPYKEDKKEVVIEVNKENAVYGLDSEKNRVFKVAEDGFEFIEVDTLYTGNGNKQIEDKTFSNKDFEDPITEAYKYGLSSSGQFYLSVSVGETAEEIIITCHGY